MNEVLFLSFKVVINAIAKNLIFRRISINFHKLQFISDLYKHFQIIKISQNVFHPFSASNLICHPESIVLVITTKQHQSCKRGCFGFQLRKRGNQALRLIDSKHLKMTNVQ